MFVCDKCGLCCKNLKNNDLYSDLDRGDGVCKYLKDNLCSIYDHRPLKCNTDKFYEKYLADKISKVDFDIANYKACQFLKRNNNNTKRS